MFHSDKTRFGSVLIGLLCLMFHSELQAQIQLYPVSVTTRLTPPYSVNLSDYAAPGCEQLKVIILQRDLTQAPYMLYLRMEIELNGKVIIRTSPQYVPPVLTIEPGIPTVISGTDLAVFLDPANMEFTGYPREAYMRSKVLPEGAYVISFTAYDLARRDVALSQGGSMFCYLAKTDPPRLNMPLNNAVVRYTQPQIINFKWLSGNTSSPNSAFSTGYRFELFEMRTGGYPPSGIVQNTRPIYACETDRTSLNYSIAEPVLEKGMRYVWRVKAFDRSGSDHIRNDGFSEVFSFLYDDANASEGSVNFNSINNFTAEAVSPKIAKLTWEGSTEYRSYKIYYRQKEKGSRWFESETNDNVAEVKGLIPGMIYECRVQGKRGNAWGSFSESDTVLMPFPAVIQCGSPFEMPNISNREPLFQLTKMQQFDAGGFMVTLIDPYAVSFSPGRFSGKGFVQVPLFGHKKILCEFTDVFINTDFQMVEGSVRLLRDEKNNMLVNLDDITEGGTDNGRVRKGTENTDIILPDVTIVNPEQIVLDRSEGEIMIIQSGDTVRMDIPEKVKESSGAVTLKDKEGTLYSIDTKTGKVTELGKTLPANSNKSSFPATIDNKVGTVRFESEKGTRYAFDEWGDDYKKSYVLKSNIFKEEYETIRLSDGGEYIVPVKLIPVGETDIVKAVIDIKDKTIKADSIMFVSGAGTMYKAVSQKKNGDEYLITLPSGKENDGLEIFAVANDKTGKRLLLGKLIVVSYSVKRPRLVLVPVNGNGSETDTAMIKRALDKIYNPVAVDWTVSMDHSNFSGDDTNLDIKGSGLFSQYTDGMKALNNSFIAHKGGSLPDESAIYLFMLKTADGNATGDMPRSKQFGYIFTETAAKVNDGLIRTIAHEISHGAFHLNHTFDNQYRIPEKSTDNLMDYTDGTKLVKHQWDAIHDPGLVIGMFERDEEGEMRLGINLTPLKIKEIIQSIRLANLSNKEELQLDLVSAVGSCTNLKIGLSKLSFIQIKTFGNIPNLNIRQLPIGNQVADHSVASLKSDIVGVHPSRYSRINYLENNVKYTKFSFSEPNEAMDTMNSRVEIIVKSIDSLVFENYINPEDEIFLKNVTWTSQFNENIFGLCTGCWKSACCRRASEYMMGNLNIANCTNSEIAKKGPNLPVSGYIILAKFADNEIKYSKETYNSATLIYNKDKIEQTLTFVKDRLNMGKPVLIGAHYLNEKSSPPNNSNRATRHYMIVIGFGKINGSYYLRFYDPGRNIANESSATSPNNMLIIDNQTGKIEAKYCGKIYTLTEILITN
jgi:hypothetical protein